MVGGDLLGVTSIDGGELGHGDDDVELVGSKERERSKWWVRG